MTSWTAETVMARLIEAAEVISISTRRDGHRKLKTLWPEWRRDYAGKLRAPRRTASPAEIARAEEALAWYALIDDDLSRCALQYQVLSAAAGISFSKICTRQGWKRTTVISRNSVELGRLAERLNRSLVPVNGAAVKEGRGSKKVRPLKDQGGDQFQPVPEGMENPETGSAKAGPERSTQDGITFTRTFKTGPFDPESFDPTWVRVQAEKRRRKLLGAEVEE
jgi:hypothetical protein